MSRQYNAAKHLLAASPVLAVDLDDYDGVGGIDWQGLRDAHVRSGSGANCLIDLAQSLHAGCLGRTTCLDGKHRAVLFETLDMLIG
jgi:hypothetical protein